MSSCTRLVVPSEEAKGFSGDKESMGQQEELITTLENVEKAAKILLQVSFVPNTSQTTEDLPQDLQKYSREGKYHRSTHLKETQQA